jgi:hypothetical protein
VMVMMDTVVDVWCGVMCLISSARYIFRRLSVILWTDFVIRLYGTQATWIRPLNIYYHETYKNIN